MYNRSPTWSVYDGIWEDRGLGHDEGSSDHGGPIPFVSNPLPRATLRGSGLKKKELLFRGGQGAVYAAHDTTLCSSPPRNNRATEEEFPQEETSPSLPPPSTPKEKGTLVAVKRLFIQPSDFGARGVAETVLREATLLSFIAQKQREGRHGLGEDARIVRLHRVVEAPDWELCLELEHCVLDLRRLIIRDARQRRAGAGGAGRDANATSHIPGMAWGMPTLRAPALEDEGEEGVRTGGVTAGNTQPATLSLPIIKYLLRRILRMVQFLHTTCHVMHRDLKLSNILVTRDGGLRLSDFGSARFMKPDGTHPQGSSTEDTNGGREEEEEVYTPGVMRTTRLYQAPECLLGNRDYGPATEVWSIGVMFAELLRQTHLFSGDSDLGLLSAIWRLLGPPASSNSSATGKQNPVTSDPAHRDIRVSQRSLPSEGHLPDFGKDSASRARRQVADPRLTTSSTSGAIGPSWTTEPTLPLKFNESVVPKDGFDLLQRMLTIVPEDRITIAEALAHPFLAMSTPSPIADASSDVERWSRESSGAAEEDARAGVAWRSFVDCARKAAETTIRVWMPELPQPSAVFPGLGSGAQQLALLNDLLGSDSDSVEGIPLGLDPIDGGSDEEEEDAENALPVFRLR